MKMKRTMAFLIAGLLSICMCVPVFATEIDSAGNVFATGATVSLPTAPFFGALAAGQTVEVEDADAKGSVMAAGQEVTVDDSRIGESAYLAGNSVSLKNTKVNGNIYMAGNEIRILGDSEGNGVYAAGSEIVFEGTTNGFFVGGDHVTVSGTINGDATISGNVVEITDDAVITGDLKVESTSEPSISDRAQVGSYTFEKVSKDEEEIGKAAAKAGVAAMILKKLSSGLYWIVAMAAFGMILCWLFNDHLAGAAQMIKENTGAMVGSGVIGWAFIPLACIFLCCTFILAPVGAMLIVLYLLLLWAGLAFAGASIARLVFPKMNVFLAALIGIAVLELVRLIPVLGWIVGAAADMYLIGYVIVTVWNHRLQKKVEVAQDNGEA